MKRWGQLFWEHSLFLTHQANLGAERMWECHQLYMPGARRDAVTPSEAGGQPCSRKRALLELSKEAGVYHRGTRELFKCAKHKMS